MKIRLKLLLPVFALTSFTTGLAAAVAEPETAVRPPAQESAAAGRKLEPLEELVRAKAKLSISAVISIARQLIDRDGLGFGGNHRPPKYDLSLFDAPDVHALIEPVNPEKSGPHFDSPQLLTPPPPKIIWWVRFQRTGASYGAPGTNIEITVADETGKATFDIQE